MKKIGLVSSCKALGFFSSMPTNMTCWVEKEYDPWEDQQRKLMDFMDQDKKDVALMKLELAKKEATFVALSEKYEQPLAAKAIAEKDLDDAKSQLTLLEGEKTKLEKHLKDLSIFELQAKGFGEEVKAFKAKLG